MSYQPPLPPMSQFTFHDRYNCLKRFSEQGLMRRRRMFLKNTGFDLSESVPLRILEIILKQRGLPRNVGDIYHLSIAGGFGCGGKWFTPRPELAHMFDSFTMGNGRTTYHLKTMYFYDFWFLLYGIDVEKELGRKGDA